MEPGQGRQYSSSNEFMHNYSTSGQNTPRDGIGNSGEYPIEFAQHGSSITQLSRNSGTQDDNISLAPYCTLLQDAVSNDRDSPVNQLQRYVRKVVRSMMHDVPKYEQRNSISDKSIHAPFGTRTHQRTAILIGVVKHEVKRSAGKSGFIGRI